MIARLSGTKSRNNYGRESPINVNLDSFMFSHQPLLKESSFVKVTAFER